MADFKKQKVGLIYKVAAFVAFLFLGYLGIRSYKESVEKLKINGCIDELGEIVRNVQDMMGRNASGYKGLDYNLAVSLQFFPKQMFREGFNEAVNTYLGGVDLFYSSLGEGNVDGAYEISFQGLSSMACKALIKLKFDTLIAVGAYPSATPSGVLDEIYLSTDPKDIKSRYIFKSEQTGFISENVLDDVCGCSDDTCTVVWKFR
ncbi:MAG: hypothetical protein J6C85_02515 [Alphaproteobacteria bacterium]|nr:hypothetical protein [Alphaproteobacteria bacterium]